MSVGDDDVAVRRDRAGRRPDERVLTRLRHAGLAEREQHLALGAELEHLKAAAGALTALSANGPLSPAQKLPSRSLTEAVRLHEHLVAERLHDLARRIEVDDRRLGSVMQPGAALAVGNDADGGAGSNGAERRPLLDHAIRVGHRARPVWRRRLLAARGTGLTGWRPATGRGLREAPPAAAGACASTITRSACGDGEAAKECCQCTCAPHDASDILTPCRVRRPGLAVSASGGGVVDDAP